MSRHNHSHCLHDLKYCDHCDVVYCTKCDREWGGHNHTYWYYSGIPYRVTWSGIGSGGWEVYNVNTNEKVTDQKIISAYNSQAHDTEPFNLNSSSNHTKHS